MRNETIVGFSSRNKLIDRLVDEYRNHTASKIILLTGPSGCGKSYVANKVVSKSYKPPLMLSYVNYGDSFIPPSPVGNLPKLKIDNFSFSVGFPYFSAGIDLGIHREDSQYNRLKSLLRTLPNGCLLFCLDGLSAAHNQVRTINLLLRLGKTEDLESKAKALKKLGVSVSYDETLPERWKLTKQQIYQTFLSALVLLLCSAVQIMGQHRREQTEALSERQALALGGLEERQLLWIFPLRTFFADLFSLLVAIAVAGIMGSISLIGLLAGGIGCAAHLGIVMSPSSSHRNCIQ